MPIEQPVQHWRCCIDLAGLRDARLFNGSTMQQPVVRFRIFSSSFLFADTPKEKSSRSSQRRRAHINQSDHLLPLLLLLASHSNKSAPKDEANKNNTMSTVLYTSSFTLAQFISLSPLHYLFDRWAVITLRNTRLFIYISLLLTNERTNEKRVEMTLDLPPVVLLRSMTISAVLGSKWCCVQFNFQQNTENSIQ